MTIAIETRCEYPGCIRKNYEESLYCVFHHPVLWRTKPDKVRYKFQQLLEQGETDFTGYNFPKVDFSEYRFDKPASFENAVFHKGINCTGVIVEEEIDFKGATIEGPAIFHDARIRENGVIDFSNTTFLNLLNLRGTNLSKIVFLGIDITAARLLGDWPTHKIKDEIVARNSEGVEKSNWLFRVAKTYKSLKSAVLNEGNYEDAGELYYREKICRKDSHKVAFLSGSKKFFKKRKKKIFFSVWREFWAWLLATLFNVTCGFGERVKRVILSGLVIIFGFSIPYFFVNSSSTTQSPIENYFDGLYLSFDSFTTLGTGDFSSLGSFRWLAQLEAFLGVFLLSLFLVVFVRKMSRS